MNTTVTCYGCDCDRHTHAPGGDGRCYTSCDRCTSELEGGKRLLEQARQYHAEAVELKYALQSRIRRAQRDDLPTETVVALAKSFMEASLAEEDARAEYADAKERREELRKQRRQRKAQRKAARRAAEHPPQPPRREPPRKVTAPRSSAEARDMPWWAAREQELKRKREFVRLMMPSDYRDRADDWAVADAT